MSDEIILRLLGIIEKLIDENERLRSKPTISPTMPVVYPKPVTIPTTYPSPIVTCKTGEDA